MKEIFKQIIVDFHNSIVPTPSHRELDLPKFSQGLKKVLVFVGMRRSGKTWALYQYMHTLFKQGVNIERMLYINFADDRLFNLQASNLQSILDAYFELYPKYVDDPNIHFFFDEIHEVANWENFIRRLLDTRKIKIYLSGSSAKMLSKEIATTLRGRTLVREIFPFSFSEYLRYINVDYKLPLSSDQQAVVKHHLRNFLFRGGFPEVLGIMKNAEKEKIAKDITTNAQVSREFCELLQGYIDVVIYRDIIERYQIRNPHVIKNLLISCLKNSTKLFSINKTFSDFKSQGYSISKNSLYKFMSYFEDAYSLFNVPAYGFSLRKSTNKEKKIYLIDQGLISAYSIKNSYEDFARFETAIFLHLRRMCKELYYYQTKNGKEVDLLSVATNGKVSLYQATVSLSNEKTEQRELESLQLAMEELGLNIGTIITLDKEKEMKVERGTIFYIPLYKFLLSKSKSI